MDADEFRRRQDARIMAHWRATRGTTAAPTSGAIEDEELSRLQADAVRRTEAMWDPEEAQDFRGRVQSLASATAASLEASVEDFAGRRVTPHWLGTYAEYLQSDHWRETRERALQRAGYRCQRCENRFGLPLDVHHRDYRHLGAERERDLMVLCRACHAVAHGEDDDVEANNAR